MLTSGVELEILLVFSFGNTVEFKCSDFVYTFSSGLEKLSHLILDNLIQPGFKTNGDVLLLVLGRF